MKSTMKKFIDHVTCSVCLLFSEYYFKLYINVNKIIADAVFYIHSQRSACCDTNKRNPKIFNFANPNFFESIAISGFGWVTVNKLL